MKFLSFFPPFSLHLIFIRAYHFFSDNYIQNVFAADRLKSPVLLNGGMHITSPGGHVTSLGIVPHVTIHLFRRRNALCGIRRNGRRRNRLTPVPLLSYASFLRSVFSQVIIFLGAYTPRGIPTIFIRAIISRDDEIQLFFLS